MHLDSMDSRFHLQRECQFVKLLNARRNLIVQCYDIGFRKVVHSIQSSEHGCVLLYCCTRSKENSSSRFFAENEMIFSETKDLPS